MIDTSPLQLFILIFKEAYIKMSWNERPGIVMLRHVEVPFKNFIGAPTNLHRDGEQPNFTCVISEQDAEALKAQQWSGIGIIAPGRPGDPVRHRVNIKVGFRKSPPNLAFKYENDSRLHPVTEETLNLLQELNILYVDVSFEPSYWSRPTGEYGFTPYVRTLVATVSEDPLAREYGFYNQAPAPTPDGEDVSF